MGRRFLPNYGARWTPQEDVVLLKRGKAGVPWGAVVAELTERFGNYRTVKGVRSRFLAIKQGKKILYSNAGVTVIAAIESDEVSKMLNAEVTG